jgi:ABC-type histidine transport system ATPase subunit
MTPLLQLGMAVGEVETKLVLDPEIFNEALNVIDDLLRNHRQVVIVRGSEL